MTTVDAIFMMTISNSIVTEVLLLSDYKAIEHLLFLIAVVSRIIIHRKIGIMLRA